MSFSSPDECAKKMIDVVPRIMQVIRAEVRSQRGGDLSVVQLRILSYVRDNPETTLAQVAEFVGITSPSASAQISKLVDRGLIQRSAAEQDRRFLALSLTDQGQGMLEVVRNQARQQLSTVFAGVPAKERAEIIAALERLEQLFAAADETSRRLLR